MALSADDLITRIVRACAWPSLEDNRPRTNAELLAIADDQILGTVWPAVISLSPDYYVCAADYTLQPDYSRYRLPGRLFGPVRDVVLVGDDGTERDVPRIDLEDLGRTSSLGNTYHHFIDGDFVGLYPTPAAGAASTTMRVRYFRAPSDLVLLAEASTIQTIDLDTAPTEFSVAATFDTLVEGGYIDVISAGNAHAVLAEDCTVTTLVGTDVTVDRSLDGSGVRFGDYVAEQGKTPILQVPDHAVPWLVALVASEALDVFDPEASALQARRAEQLAARMRVIAAPRTMSSPTTWNDPNSPWGG